MGWTSGTNGRGRRRARMTRNGGWKEKTATAMGGQQEERLGEKLGMRGWGSGDG